MTTITIATHIGFCNRGAEALLKTRINLLKHLIPNLRFKVLTIYTETCQPIKNVEYINTFGGQKEKLNSIGYITVSLLKGISWTFSAFTYRFFNFSLNKNINKLSESSMFVSTDGDVLGEDYGLFPLIWRIYYLSLGLFMKKPVFIFSEGAGPFKSKLAKFISKAFFKKCTYISVRDKISYSHLINLGLKKNDINLTADSALLLKPSTTEHIFTDSKKILIGIAVSKLVADFGFPRKDNSTSYQSFVNFTAELIDWIVSNINSKVILISHVVQINRDDYQTSQDIFLKLKNKSDVEIIDKSYNSEELKYIISQCNLLISSRMHAAIAALSTYVPTIGISYSHKMEGIFKRLNIPEYVIDIKKLDWKIIKLIQQALSKSKIIKGKLKKRIPSMIYLAQKPAIKITRTLKQNINWNK